MDASSTGTGFMGDIGDLKKNIAVTADIHVDFKYLKKGVPTVGTGFWSIMVCHPRLYCVSYRLLTAKVYWIFTSEICDRHEYILFQMVWWM